MISSSFFLGFCERYTARQWLFIAKLDRSSFSVPRYTEARISCGWRGLPPVFRRSKTEYMELRSSDG